MLPCLCPSLRLALVVVLPSQTKNLHPFLNRQPQQAPFGDLQRAPAHCIPLVGPDGNNQRRSVSTEKGARVSRQPELRARLCLSTRPSPRTIKRACHRSNEVTLNPALSYDHAHPDSSSRKSSRSNNVHLLRISSMEYPLGGLGFPPFAPSHRKPRSKKKQELPSSKQKQLEPAAAHAAQQPLSLSPLVSLVPTYHLWPMA